MSAETPGVLVADLEVAPLLVEDEGVANLSPAPLVDWKLRMIFLGICLATIALVLLPSFSQSLVKSNVRAHKVQLSDFGSATFKATNIQNGDHNTQTNTVTENITKVIEGKRCEGSGNAFSGGGGAAQVVCCSGKEVQCCGAAVGAVDMARKVQQAEDAPATATEMECTSVRRSLGGPGASFSADTMQNGDHNVQNVYPQCTTTKLPSDDKVKMLCTKCVGDADQDCDNVPEFMSLTKDQRFAAQLKTQYKTWSRKIHEICPHDSWTPDPPKTHDWEHFPAISYQGDCGNQHFIAVLFIDSDENLQVATSPVEHPSNLCQDCNRWVSRGKIAAESLDAWMDDRKARKAKHHGGD